MRWRCRGQQQPSYLHQLHAGLVQPHLLCHISGSAGVVSRDNHCPQPSRLQLLDDLVCLRPDAVLHHNQAHELSTTLHGQMPTFHTFVHITEAWESCTHANKVVTRHDVTWLVCALGKSPYATLLTCIHHNVIYVASYDHRTHTHLQLLPAEPAQLGLSNL